MRPPPFLYRFSFTSFYVLAHVAFDWKTRLGSGTKWCACSNEDLLTTVLVSPSVAFTFLVPTLSSRKPSNQKLKEDREQ